MALNGEIGFAYFGLCVEFLHRTVEFFDATFNNDNSQLLTVGCNTSAEDCTEGRISLIDVGTGSVLGVIPVEGDALQSVTYNADGTRFLTTDSTATVIERSATTGEEIASYPASAPVLSATYSNDGTTIIIDAGAESLETVTIEQ